MATALSLVAMIAVVGLSVDIGRMYIAKNEVQNFVDSASLAATLELDGSWQGIDRARASVGNNQNRWAFNTSRFSQYQIAFAQNEEGPWTLTPTQPNSYRYARVTANIPVSLFFVPAAPSGQVQSGSPVSFLWAMGFSANVKGDSASGQIPEPTFTEGLFPFSPFAHDNVGPHYGLVPGQRYTLRWAANPKVGSNTCPGDDLQSMVDLANAGGGSERGYIEETSADMIRKTIEQDYQSVTKGVGDMVNMTGGAKNTEKISLVNRVMQDTDSYSLTYSDYNSLGLGNGRRVVGVLINTGHPDYRVVQIGAFFLLSANDYDAGGNNPFCAEYLGAWVKGSKYKGAADAGPFVAKLVQ